MCFRMTTVHSRRQVALAVLRREVQGNGRTPQSIARELDRDPQGALEDFCGIGVAEGGNPANNPTSAATSTSRRVNSSRCGCRTTTAKWLFSAISTKMHGCRTVELANSAGAGHMQSVATWRWALVRTCRAIQPSKSWIFPVVNRCSNTVPTQSTPPTSRSGVYLVQLAVC